MQVAIDRTARVATITLLGPQGAQPAGIAGIMALGDQWAPLKFARELDDAILMLRTNDLEVGTWVFKSSGSIETQLAVDKTLAEHKDHWLVRETTNFLRRVLRRIDVSSRSIFALVEAGSCFAGTLLEVVLAADRSFMLDSEETDAPKLALSAMNFGPLTMNNDLTRIQTRFAEEEAPVQAVSQAIGRTLSAADAAELGLVTFTPDALDWSDEIRIALEERASLSPDALTGMEANLRFAGRETMDTRVFGRLTAWQNWIFQRPNAVGEKGALKVYGSGNKSQFNWERV